MRAMRQNLQTPRLRCLAALAFLMGTATLAACSSDNKTVLALTINSDDTIGVVDHLSVTVSSASHADVTKMILPNKDPDSGVIAPSFYSRIELDGFKGDATVKVDAVGTSGATIASAMTTAEIRENGAVAARVSLTTKKPDAGMPAPDAGAAGGDAGADGGDAGAN